MHAKLLFPFFANPITVFENSQKNVSVEVLLRQKVRLFDFQHNEIPYDLLF